MATTTSDAERQPEKTPEAEKAPDGTEAKAAGASEMSMPVAGEPNLEDPDYTCKKCGAKFAGEGAQKAYRIHLADFHPGAE